MRKDKKQEQNQTQDKMEYKGLKYADFENQRAITNKSYKIKKKDETKSKISDEENKERTNFNINKNCSSRRIIKKFCLKKKKKIENRQLNYQEPKKIFEIGQKSENEQVLNNNDKKDININISNKKNEKRKIFEINNKNENKAIKIYNTIYKHKINNNNKNKFIQIIQCFILFILLCRFYSMNSLGFDRQNKGFTSYSYEVTLRVKGTGNKYILSKSSTYIYQCPSIIYLDNELLNNYGDCHYININKANIDIKLVWENIVISSMRGMFYYCTEITKIDLTKFDTSSVNDMTQMFESCISLNSLNVSNLDTSKVISFYQMFSGCTSLISLNLESFTNPSATTLAGMFSGCKNLEYINIKNFEEKQNLNIDNMFYNIPPNAIICLSSCPPPTNLTISQISYTDKKATIEWEGYEWNKVIISYSSQSSANPNNGKNITVIDARNYTFTNLNLNTVYYIYLKTDCDSKSSYWLGPLLIYIESYNMPDINRYTYTPSISTCLKVIYDYGGPNQNYPNNLNSYLEVYPQQSGKYFSIRGKVNTEKNFDILTIYHNTGSRNIELGKYSGYQIVGPLIIKNGHFLLKFSSDSANTYPGYELTVNCIFTSPQTIYSSIKEKPCQKISCVEYWKSIQNISVSCVKNCNLISNKYQYRGTCYQQCPEGTTNVDYFCYIDYIIESCEKYTIESEYENACTKCKKNYYTILGDNGNYYHCYKNNSLDNYYLDNNDLLFKPCYISCKTCDKKGTIEKHNCLSCDVNYFPKYEEIVKNGTYIDCYKEIEGYTLCNNQYFVEYQCYQSCEFCSKEGNIEYHNCIKCKKEYPYEVYIASQLNCYKRCEFDFYYNENNQISSCYPENNCIDYYNELKAENTQRIYNCDKFPNYPSIDSKENCYNLYPAIVPEDTPEKEYLCDIKCSDDKYYLKKCAQRCALFHLNSNTYKFYYNNNNRNSEKIAQENMVEHIKKEMIKGIDLSELDNGEDIIIYGNDITLTLMKSKTKSESVTPKIDLRICESYLKSAYNISENASLYILKMEVKQEGYKIPKIQYEVYFPLNNDTNLTILDLSICEDTDINIDVYLHVDINGNLEQYVPNSDFYNDICNTFTSEHGTDLTISARKRYYIDNKLAICEENCNFINYIETSGDVICSCKIKKDFVNNISLNKFDDEELFKSFTDFYNIFNIKILNCMNLIFKVNAIKQNYANIILIIIIVLYFFCLIFFICKSYPKEIEYFIDIITYFALFPNKIMNIIRKKGNRISLINLKKKSEIKKVSKLINDRIKKPIIKNLNNDNKNIKDNMIKKIRHLKTENTFIIKPPLYNYLFKNKNKVMNKDGISPIIYHITNDEKDEPLKQNEKSEQMETINISKKRNIKKDNIINKIKTEEIANEKLLKQIDNYEKLDKLSDEQIYDLYKKINSKTDNELNDLSYKLALKYDKRSYCQFYFSLLKNNHLLFFSFIPNFDFNSRIIKIYLFFFYFATFFFVNALFFNDETMGKINQDRGAFNFLYNLPQIIYSSIISAIINIIIKALTITENNFIEFRNKSKKEKKDTLLISVANIKKKLKIKFVIFFFLDLIFLECFWIYLSCFSAVYHNTQMHLIKDTIISFGTSFLSPLGIYLLPGIFRIPALKNNKRKILYGLSKVLQLL